MTIKCKHRELNGKRCEADAKKGSNICIFHDPVNVANPFRTSHDWGLDKTGGMLPLPAERPEKPIQTSIEAGAMLAKIIDQVNREEICPKKAAAMGNLVGHFLHAHELSALEQWVAEVESDSGRQARKGGRA